MLRGQEINISDFMWIYLLWLGDKKLIKIRPQYLGGNMELTTNATDIRWWFWATTLAFIVAAVGGWIPGYYIVMGISAVQVLFFLLQEKSLAAFPTQIRVVYFGFALFGLWPEVRLFLYLILLLGTIMVVFFGRCSIALILKHMPWNRGREARLN